MGQNPKGPEPKQVQEAVGAVVGRRLVAAAERAQKTPTALAKLVGLDGSGLRRIFEGHKAPALYQVPLFAEALGVTSSDLMPQTGTEAIQEEEGALAARAKALNALSGSQIRLSVPPDLESYLERHRVSFTTGLHMHASVQRDAAPGVEHDDAYWDEIRRDVEAELAEQSAGGAGAIGRKKGPRAPRQK